MIAYLSNTLYYLAHHKYDDARNVLMDSIKNIWSSSKIKGSCNNVTESLSLAPPHDDSDITKKAQRKINALLFDFLASIDRTVTLLLFDVIRTLYYTI